MRKLFLLLLALCSVCFITACGGDEENGTTSEEGKACTQNMDCPIGYHCDTAKGECTSDSGNNGGGNGGGSTGDSGGNGGGDNGDSGNGGNGGNGDSGNGGPTTCEANKFLRCDPDDETFNKIIRCNRAGTGEESIPCGEDSVCDNDRCVQQECIPGKPICSQNDISKVFKCSEKGLFTGEIAKDCGNGKCINGDCTSLCEQAAQDHSYQGCDFFTTVSTMTVDWTTNRGDPIFALTISNTSKTDTVNVSITVSSESGETDAGLNYFCIDSENNCQTLSSTQSLSVEPGKLGIVMFPNDRNISGTGLKWNSLHIATDLPVSIFQFAPIDNSDKNPFESSGISANGQGVKFYSNDASLLIPTPSVYTDYIVSAHSVRNSNFTTYATVIGISEAETVITVKPTAAITASNGIPAIAANTEGTITLKKGQVAQIEAKGNDLSGTRIYCDATKSDCHPFVVFSGSDCTFVPTTYGYCDHIEQQLFPVQTWGKKYILVKSQARGEEWDLVRIYASKDGTTLTFKPATPVKISVPSGWKDFTVNDVKTALNAGEYSEFYFKGTLTVEANNQIMVAQYLTGADMISKSCQNILGHGSECVGDPAMMLIPPHEQFRKDYLFLTPGSYVSNFATIIMTTGESPVLNGETITGTEIEGTNFSYAIVDLGSAFANHTLTCEKNPCGLFVYGWEKDVSYAYPGGLNFEKLSTN